MVQKLRPSCLIDLPFPFYTTSIILYVTTQCRQFTSAYQWNNISAFQSAVPEGGASVQVCGTGEGLLSQGDYRGVRHGRRGYREFAPHAGTRPLWFDPWTFPRLETRLRGAKFVLNTRGSESSRERGGARWKPWKMSSRVFSKIESCVSRGDERNFAWCFLPENHAAHRHGGCISKEAGGRGNGLQSRLGIPGRSANRFWHR